MEERTKAVGPGGIQRCVHSASSGQPRPPADLSPGASAENVPWKTMVSCLGLSLSHQPHQPPVVEYNFLASKRSHTHQRQPGPSPQLSPASPLEDHRYLLTGLSAPPGPYRGPRHPRPSRILSHILACCSPSPTNSHSWAGTHLGALGQPRAHPSSFYRTHGGPSLLTLFFFKDLFFWLHQVFVCSMWDLSSRWANFSLGVALWLSCPVACGIGSSPTRNRTRVPFLGRWILNHSTTGEVPFFNGEQMYLTESIIILIFCNISY